MMEIIKTFVINLQLFAESGTVVNGTAAYTNAYTGQTTPYGALGTTTQGMSPTMKTFYDTDLLENARERLFFHQAAKKFNLGQHKGMTMEWRKFNTLPDLDKLQEAVIPEGKKLGMTYTTAEIAQYGAYVTISDQLELHAVDNVVLGATEELGAAAALTIDKLDRAELMTSSNLLFADVLGTNGEYDSTPATHAALKAALTAGKTAPMTARLIALATTVMKKNKVAPHTGSDYLAVIHPSVAYDLRQDEGWVEAHKYSATTEIFNGEIGQLHGMRFVESNLAPVIKGENDDEAIYMTIVVGKDAFGAIEVEGASMKTIIKNKGEVGGPLTVSAA